MQCFHAENSLKVEEMQRLAEMQGLAAEVEMFPLDKVQKALGEHRMYAR